MTRIIELRNQIQIIKPVTKLPTAIPKKNPAVFQRCKQKYTNGI